MFLVNDYIIYGNNGVCKVINVGTLDMAGIDKSKLYYTLLPLNSKGNTIYTPVDNKNIIMRKLISLEEANQLIEDIPDIQNIWEINDKQREEKFKEILKKFECREWIKLIKTIYVRKQQRLSEGKKITNTDIKYLHIAEDLLFSELSISLGISKDKVEEHIFNQMKGKENALLNIQTT